MKKIILVLWLSTSPLVYADKVTSPWFVPQEVGGDYNGPVFVIPPDGLVSDCPNGIQAFPGVPDTESNEQGYKSFMAVAMTAFTTRRQVQIEYNNGPGCYSYKIKMK